LLYAKSMLFINHCESEFSKDHVTGQQCMGPNHHVDGALAEPFEDASSVCHPSSAREQLQAKWPPVFMEETIDHCLERSGMLLGQHFGWNHECTLSASIGNCQKREQCHDGLS